MFTELLSSDKWWDTHTDRDKEIMLSTEELLEAVFSLWSEQVYS
jgi:hypothetical protein